MDSLVQMSQAELEKLVQEGVTFYERRHLFYLDDDGIEIPISTAIQVINPPKEKTQ